MRSRKTKKKPPPKFYIPSTIETQINIVVPFWFGADWAENLCNNPTLEKSSFYVKIVKTSTKTMYTRVYTWDI